MGGRMLTIPLQQSEDSTLWSQAWFYASSSDVVTNVRFCGFVELTCFFLWLNGVDPQRKAEALARVTQRRSAPHDAGPRFTFLPEPHLPSGVSLFSLSHTFLSRYPTSSPILSPSNAPAAAY